ncbi:MAG TPA: SBBP repeat-containing protein [Candidatus Eremiobacteraceae bacterium]|nr:SBBP repeat-containing protein [Candidatus Eremiobacteraceae bacterium]
MRHAAKDVDDARIIAAKSFPEGSGKFLQQEHSYFERNEGQVDSEVQYLNHGKDYSLFLTRTGVTVVLPETGRKAADRTTSQYFRLRFEGANPGAEIAGIERLPGTSNYFSGSDPKQWRTRIPQFGRVRYSNLYPGVDLIFYFRDGQLEYDVVAAPGADASAVRLKVERANADLTPDGDVAIKLGAKEVVRLRKPHSYQDGEPGRAVETKYSLGGDEISFALGPYDRRRAVTIDPALAFASVVTSNCIPYSGSVCCEDSIGDLTADNTGVYLTGSTYATTFPATSGSSTVTTTSSLPQTFITKIDPTGTHVLFTAFLAASGGSSIAVDPSGNVYLTGYALTGIAASLPAFPLTQGVFSGTVPSNAIGSAAYAAKLSANGSTIVYSTLLEQLVPSGTPTANYQFVTPVKVAVDASGALYITGTAQQNTISRILSVWQGVPTTIGAFQTTPGSMFVMKLNPNATGLDYATYIDGTLSLGGSAPVGVAVDGNGDAFVAGTVAGSNFPTTPGAYRTSNPDPSYYQAFATELNPTGTAQVYSTLFGAGTENTLAAGMGLIHKGEWF